MGLYCEALLNNNNNKKHTQKDWQLQSHHRDLWIFLLSFLLLSWFIIIIIIVSFNAANLG